MQHPPPSFEFTPAARAALVRVCARSGPQAVVLSWPAGITYLPARCYRRAEFDVALARFEQCAVYADSRGLTLFLNRHVVVDAERTAQPRARPVLRVRSTPDGGDRHGSLVPGAELLAPQFGRTAMRLVDDLAGQFRGRVSESMIWTLVREAVAELKGSVGAESLPEMVSRLVSERLSHTPVAR